MRRQKVFQSPYLGIDEEQYLFTQNGDYSVVYKIANPVLQYAADEEAYHQFHLLMDNVISILGPGNTVQKLDIFTNKTYSHQSKNDYLSQAYYQHFEGRNYIDHSTYFILTGSEKKNRFFTADPKTYHDFKNKTNKIYQLFQSAGCAPQRLKGPQLKTFIQQILTFQFDENPCVYHNLDCTADHIIQGDYCIKNLSLIDIEKINLPASLQNASTLQDHAFPVDLMHFLTKITGCHSMVYHQVIEVPDQGNIISLLKMKRKRHISIPDPANQLSVKDIDAVLEEIADNNSVLVYSHYNIAFKTNEDKLHQVHSQIESQLFKLGVIPSANDHNQLEMFRTILPGNTGELKDYNKFLTSGDAAICLMYKERWQKDEASSFQVSFCDRNGIPINIDPNDLPIQKGRINNRNKFVLGPSGSGKSFFMNHLIRQYYQHDMDIVLVDTGHSYEGLCQYYHGQYITYQEDKPITMNPFNVNRAEFNEEKREFLKALIGLLWKGTDGVLSQIEDTMLSKVIHHYYAQHWEGQIHQLSFNTFYEYSILEIATIAGEEGIPFDLETYRFVLKKFYRGGHYEDILNKDMESSLFDAPFIVFEIDAITEHKILFPITTLIIMDVFLQKMRIKENRKCLIIEEAWKAIASPMMAGYILYLYKTIRKFRGEAIVVTQELDDIICNDIVKDSIISNSDCLCLLDQNKFRDNYHQVAKLLSLNKVEQRKIFTINRLDNKDHRGRFKEVYIKRGATGEVYGVEVSPEEYLVYTTERSEKEAVRAYVREYGSIEAALKAFTEDYKKAGMSLAEFCEKIGKGLKAKAVTGPKIRTKS